VKRARTLFQQRYGIKAFQRLEGPLAAGGYIHVELAWVGNTMYELLTASGPGSELFIAKLPTSEFAILHHHLGFLAHDKEEWNALLAEIEHKDWKLLSTSHAAGIMQKM